MQNKHKQMSLFDTYSCVSQAMEENKPEIIRLLDEHIDRSKTSFDLFFGSSKPTS